MRSLFNIGDKIKSIKAISTQLKEYNRENTVELSTTFNTNGYNIVLENENIKEIISEDWINIVEESRIIFTIRPDFPYGVFNLYLEKGDLKSNKITVGIKEIEILEAFEEDFSDVETLNNNWTTLNRAWGGDNGGVVAENVYLDEDENNTVLVLESHGDLYDGDIQGVDRYGNKKYKEDGVTPYTTRVGGVIASNKYASYGSFEFESKVIQKLGVCSAFWNFHYQEVYPEDLRWDKMIGDYVREEEMQEGLQFQFNTLQHQNTNISGVDNATSFITDQDNTTYDVGVKGEPNTIGDTLRYNGNAGYAIDLLNTSTIESPRNSNWLLSFWCKVDENAGTNLRHNIITQGNFANALGVQVFYKEDTIEFQGSIRTNSDALTFFGENVDCNYGEWYHITLGGKDGELIQCINGKEVMRGSIPDDTFNAQSWWRCLQNDAIAGGSAGNNVKDISISSIRLVKDYYPSIKEIRVMYGRPYYIGGLDFSYLNLNISGNEELGYYVVRNNEIDIEIPSHLLPNGDIENPSLQNGKFNTWKGELQNWEVNKSNYQYWEEYRDDYFPLGIDVTDNEYHTYRYDWFPDRVEFYIDNVLISTNIDFKFGYNSLNIPDVVSKITLGNWFPSANIKWAGENADFNIEKMYVRKIKYTPFEEYNNEIIKVGETYPSAYKGNIKYNNQ